MGGKLFSSKSTRWTVESETFVWQTSRSRRSRMIGVEGGRHRRQEVGHD
jgi:hypothetical protein